MPKRARFPVFLLGLAVILLGSIGASAAGAGADAIATIVIVGFALLVLSVAVR